MTAEIPSSEPGSYPIGERNRIRRAHERGSYDRAAVWAILDAAMLCHVAYEIDGRPYCTPTIHWRDGDRLYWHGSSAGRMLRRLAGGVPVCLTVSHLDGLVMARSAFHHSVNYRSAMCFGTARQIEDRAEKIAALDGLVERFYPGRAATLRPTNEQELKATMVVAMTIEEAAAKVRAAGVADDPADLAHPVWAGVVPITTIVGTAEPSPQGVAVEEIPPDVAVYAAGHRFDEAATEAARRYASVRANDGAA